MSIRKNELANEDHHLSVTLAGRQEPQTFHGDAIVLEGHDGTVLTSRFSHSSGQVASGGFDRTILLWNVNATTNDELNYGVMRGHKNAITSIRWLEGDECLVSGSADHTLGLWDCYKGNRIRTFRNHDLIVNEVENSDNQILSVGDDGNAILWDPRQKKCRLKMVHEYPLLTCCFNSSGNTFYISGIDPRVKAFDTRKPDSPLWICGGQKEAVTSVSLSHDNSILISRSLAGSIRSYLTSDFITGKDSRLSPYVYEGAISGAENYLIKACFSPNDVNIVSGSEDHTVTEWNYRSRKITEKYKGHFGSVIDVSFDSSGRLLMSTSTDGTIILRKVSRK